MNNIYFVSLSKDVPSLFKPKSDEVEFIENEVRIDFTLKDIKLILPAECAYLN
jgi:hypothetical protein